MLGRWAGLSTIEAEAEMMQLTLVNVSRALFSTDMRDRAGEFNRAFGVANEQVSHLLTTPVAAPLWLPTKRNRNFRAAMETLDHIVNDLISFRKQSTNRPDDLLTMLLDVRYEDTGEAMTDKQLRDEVMALLIAGHETTANTLTWALHLLATHPDVQRQVCDQVRSVLDKREATISDIDRLTLVRAVVDETLRLYPTAFMLTRQAREADVIGSVPIRAGAVIFVGTWNVHRHPEFWTNPERFDPQRFIGEQQERPRFAYLPFGGGPRQCIGMSFALMEMTLVLSSILQRCQVSSSPGAPPVEIHALTSLRTRHGLHLNLKWS